MAETLVQTHGEWALPANVKRQQRPQIIVKTTELQLESSLFLNSHSPLP